MTVNKSKNLPAPKQNEQMIPILSNQLNQPYVDARSLHGRLCVQTKFIDWIKRRISECGFLPEEYVLLKFGKEIDYQVTLDMAKELAMLEKNEIGRKFRKYFIEAEKELRQVRMYGMVSSLSELKKVVRVQKINGRELYPLRALRAALGFSTKASTSCVKNLNAGLYVNFNNVGYVAEEYVKLLIARSTARMLRTEAIQAQPVLPLDWGNTQSVDKSMATLASNVRNNNYKK